MELSLKGRVALVTGSGQGIGAAIATQLAHSGAWAAVCDLHHDRASAVAATLSGQGLEAEAFTCDVTSPAAVAELVRAVTSVAGPIDVVVNNVGWAGDDPFVSLSDGHVIGPGSWAIPLFGLATLKANIPAGVSGRSVLVVTLVSVDGTLLAEGRTELVVGPAAMLTPGERQPEPSRASTLVPPIPVPAGRPDRNSAPRPPELSAEEKARAEKLMVQGERYLGQGNIALAREFYRRAADTGLAQAAVRLAATYDPSELGRLQVQGVVPDRAEARKWYERARELGAPEAEERLARLDGS